MTTTAQHLIAYRRELNDGGLTFDLVDELVKSAAQTLVANEGLRTLSPDPIRIVVCAATGHQAQQWVNKHNLYPRQVLIAKNPDALHGLTDFAVVTLPGFETRLDAQRITEVLKAMHGGDFTDQYANPSMIGTAPGRF
ncbi:hypothetical protein ACIO3R_07295 [Streptomyces sp. NPDC087428]|uniref:hypothetical protein n=1 Tax=Streptomyces sp. NPDC087428 TaxID=3365788 RepID=UPI00381BA150